LCYSDEISHCGKLCIVSPCRKIDKERELLVATYGLFFLLNELFLMASDPSGPPSQAWLFGLSLARNTGSNPAGGTVVCFL